MKKSSHDISLPVEQQHFKKKYLLRKLEEKEAEEQIEDFDGTEESEWVDDLRRNG